MGIHKQSKPFKFYIGPCCTPKPADFTFWISKWRGWNISRISLAPGAKRSVEHSMHIGGHDWCQHWQLWWCCPYFPCCQLATSFWSNWKTIAYLQHLWSFAMKEGGLFKSRVYLPVGWWIDLQTSGYSSCFPASRSPNALCNIQTNNLICWPVSFWNNKSHMLLWYSHPVKEGHPKCAPDPIYTMRL